MKGTISSERVMQSDSILTLCASSSAITRPEFIGFSRNRERQISKSEQALLSSTKGQLRSTMVRDPGSKDHALDFLAGEVCLETIKLSSNFKRKFKGPCCSLLSLRPASFFSNSVYLIPSFPRFSMAISRNRSKMDYSVLAKSQQGFK